MKMKVKKISAFLLTIALMFTLLLSAQANDFDTQADQAAQASTAESVTLPVSEKVELTSDASGDSQWQIRAGDDLWVDISGADNATLQLSYSMVANLLNDGTAQVRCKTTNGDQVTYGTEYQVTVDYDAVPEFTPAEQPDPSTLVVSEAQVVSNSAEPSTGDAAAEPEALAPATSEDALTEEEASAFSSAPAKAPRRTMSLAPDAAPADEDGDSEVKPTYILEIQYVFGDGRQAANSWTGSYAEGEPLDDITVESPEVVGYQPEYDSINLRERFPNGLTENTRIQVLYTSAQVTYTVEYYEQNLNDDNYTLVSTETKDGYTEDPVGDQLAPDKEGFVALLYDTSTKIAADSSTVVEIYYDRLYYLMTFALDGGYGVEPIYARYGTPISVGTPTKPGYTFEGWTLNGSDATVPATMPAENQNYAAKWVAGDSAKVTVVFWGENADDEAYSYLGSYETTATPNTRFEFTSDDITGSGASQILICGKEEHIHTDACIQCTHTHTLECYSVARNYSLQEIQEPTGHDLNDRGDGIFTYTVSRQTHYYLHLGDKWYCAYNRWDNVSDTQRISLSCTHQHDASCYICGKEEHRHTASCYLSSILDPDLWELNTEKTEAIDSVAANGSSVLNVYFDRTEFTLYFQEQQGSIWNTRWETVATITAKWGAEISGKFAEAPFSTDYEGRAWECTDDTKYSYALQTLDRMPQFNATFHLYNKSSNTLKTIYYYVENVGANVDASRWPSNPGNNFTLLKTVETYFNYATYEEEYHEIEGFTRYDRSTAGFNNSNQKDFSNRTLYLYYLRNDYPLVFNNGYEDVRTEQVQYEAPLSTYSDFVPEMPTELYEPGSHVFAGWYLNPECTGDEYKLDEHTMPLDGLILYAKWEPIVHTVTFHLDNTMQTEVGNAVEVSHGEMIELTSVPEEATLKAANDGQYANEGYTLVGWFYKDEDGNEKAFDPANMPVNRDLELYAKWTSNVLKPYVIRYFTKDAEGNKVYIADETTGSALAGTTKTFNAKAGNELYTDYQEGYFPLYSSHSITIDIKDDDTDPTVNVYEFEYVPRKFVSYTVRYVEEGNESHNLANQKNATSANAVVTEKYQYISGGWMPDAYQKRLVLAASPLEDSDEAEQWELEHNVITFYYHHDEKHAPVHVVHMLQNIEGDGYTLYDEYTDLTAEIDQPYTADVLTDITGATFDHATANGTAIDADKTATQITQTVTDQGLELVLYYNRNLYPYEFHFVDQSTGKEIADPVKGNERYEAQVTQNALNISGYALAEGEPDSKAIKIQMEDTAVKNVATFYYVPSTASLTISKNVTDDNYDGQLFLFHVQGPDFNMDVVVPGNGSVTIAGLKVGQKYTITEDTSWSWRYTPSNSGELEITLGADGSCVSFTNTRSNNQWVDSNTSAENQWQGNTVTRQ